MYHSIRRIVSFKYSPLKCYSTLATFESDFAKTIEKYGRPNLSLVTTALDTLDNKPSSSSDFSDQFKEFCQLHSLVQSVDAIRLFGRHLCDRYVGLSELFFTVLPYSTELTEACYAAHNVIVSEDLAMKYRLYLSAFEKARASQLSQFLPSLDFIPDYHRRFTLSRERVDQYRNLRLICEQNRNLGIFDEFIEDMESELYDVEYQSNMVLTQVQYDYGKSCSRLLNYQRFIKLLDFMRKDAGVWLHPAPQQSQIPFVKCLETYGLTNDAFRYCSNLKYPPYLFVYLLQHIQNDKNRFVNLINGENLNATDGQHQVSHAVYIEIGLLCAAADSNTLLSIEERL